MKFIIIKFYLIFVWSFILLTPKISFSQNYKIVKDNIACLYGVKDTSGNWVIEAKFLNIKPSYRKEFFLVQENSGWGVMKVSGEFLIKPKFSSITEDNYSKYYFVTSLDYNNKLYGLYSWKGKVIFPAKYISISKANYYFILNEAGKFGIADTNQVYLNPIYDQLSFLNSSLKTILFKKYIKQNDGIISRYGIINLSGDTLVRPEYENIKYSKGFYYYLFQNKWCISNDKGDTIVPKGTKVVSNVFNRNGYINDTREIFAFSRGKKWGLMNLTGKIILDTIYDEIEYPGSYFNSHYAWKFKLNDKYGLLNSSGEISLPANFSEIEVLGSNSGGVETNFIIEVKDGLNTGVLNLNGDTLIDIKYKKVYYSYYLNEDEMYFVELFDEERNKSNEIPIIYQSPIFSNGIPSLLIYKLKNKFISFYDNHQYPNSISKLGHNDILIKPKRNNFEVIFHSDTFCLNKKGELIKDPFRNKTILFDLKSSLVYVDHKLNSYGLIDTMGNNLLDSVYRKIYYFGNSIWVKENGLSKCRFNQNYYSNYPFPCPCGWIRYDKNGKKMDEQVYDLPTEDAWKDYPPKETAVIYLNNKAALYNFKTEKFLTQPDYVSISPLNERKSSVLAGKVDDSTFVVMNENGKLISNQKWNTFIPIQVVNTKMKEKLQIEGYSSQLFILNNKEDELLIDITGRRLPSKIKLKDLYGIYDENQFPFSSGNYIYEKFGSPWVIHYNKFEINTNWINFYWDKIFSEYKNNISCIPGGVEYIVGCNCVFNDTYKYSSYNPWVIVFADDLLFSISIPYHVNYNDSIIKKGNNFQNFYKNGDSIQEIHISSFFQQTANIPAIMNELILDHIATRDDLNLDCNNPNSFYFQSAENWYLSKEGIRLPIQYKFEAIITWEKLLQYSPDNIILQNIIKYISKE